MAGEHNFVDLGDNTAAEGQEMIGKFRAALHDLNGSMAKHRYASYSSTVQYTGHCD